jgi:hypothetical protein
VNSGGERRRTFESYIASKERKFTTILNRGRSAMGRPSRPDHRTLIFSARLKGASSGG